MGVHGASGIVDPCYFITLNRLLMFLAKLYPQEAVEIVHLNLEKGAEAACQKLIETATERWAEEEGDYRDDVSLRFKKRFTILRF